MKILLGKEEALGFIHSALCNGGVSELVRCGIQLDYSDEEYKKAKEEVQKVIDAGKHESIGIMTLSDKPTICREDVWSQILRGGTSLKFYNNEEEESLEFTLEQAVERLGNESAANVILTYKNEGDDAWTAFDLLQHCLFGEVIYG